MSLIHCPACGQMHDADRTCLAPAAPGSVNVARLLMAQAAVAVDSARIIELFSRMLSLYDAACAVSHFKCGGEVADLFRMVKAQLYRPMLHPHAKLCAVCAQELVPNAKFVFVGTMDACDACASVPAFGFNPIPSTAELLSGKFEKG